MKYYGWRKSLDVRRGRAQEFGLKIVIFLIEHSYLSLIMDVIPAMGDLAPPALGAHPILAMCSTRAAV